MTSIIADGLDGFSKYIAAAPEIAKTSARLAINQIADRKALPLAKVKIAEQVKFPSGYLNSDRLGVTSRATSSNLEAVITGRQRPTSLARFVTDGSTPNQNNPNGISVMIKPGVTRVLKRAFLVRLRQGDGTGAGSNLGLAVRLKPGDTLINKTGTSRPLGNGLFLLYGPSVEQVFRSVADDIAPEVLDDLEEEFLRQFILNSGA